MMTDPIADMLTRIRNAQLALHDAVDMPGSTPEGEHRRRCSRRRATSTDYERPRGPTSGPTCVIKLKYGPTGEPVIRGIAARLASPAGASTSTGRRSRGCSAAWASASSRPPQGVITGHEARAAGSAARSSAPSGEGRPSHEPHRTRPIPIPDGVTVELDGAEGRGEGPQGRARAHGRRAHPRSTARTTGPLVVTRPTDRGPHRALHGLTRAPGGQHGRGRHQRLRAPLEIVGVGYRAQLKGKNLVLTVGFSHPVDARAPRGHRRSSVADARRRSSCAGIDKQAVGQLAAKIRQVRPPEPYKGKGIRYEGEHVRRKAGKRA